MGDFIVGLIVVALLFFAGFVFGCIYVIPDSVDAGVGREWKCHKGYVNAAGDGWDDVSKGLVCKPVAK